MKLIEFNIENTPSIDQDIVLVLGYFDGLHLGHQILIEKAKKEGYPVGVLTFDNSPSFVLGRKVTNTCLTSITDKAELLEKMGVSYLYLMRFDEQTALYSKDEFVDLVLKKINPKKIFVGEDYTFGSYGSGNAKYLTNYFDVSISSLAKINNVKVSSREIRELVANGEMKKAAKLLGRPYRISGLVVPGNRKGRTIDFPTANLDLDYPYVFPRLGVYMGYVDLYGNKYKAIISVGTHPTILQLVKPIIEVHIIDINEDLYGRTLFVEFVSLIRDIQKFDSLEDLKAQIELDKQKAKKELQ